ncbi:hypothetical protein J2Z62_000735 [Mycoplasmoides fastidiosum]|uniref:Lipoprotein n=1 Tax=Mycoplasmoides fastidiosum TaxID=92758 RepID=A0ABU0M016_9BACT|nr:hypothetical protein [Mycoplasmoides fastidiosum]MDQ0514297.1 hypothetical protein [Mycoplasmoides fastidiosum]UUD38098.1 hypothetical protein NPA10_01795 [Mycoplasmoides fastidiosum]
MKLSSSQKASRRLFALGPVFAMTAATLLSACSTTTLPYLRNEYYFKVNSDPTKVKTRAFDWDYTKVAAGKSYSNITPNLIEYQYSGDFTLNSEGKPTPESNAKYKITFAAAKAVHVTVEENGQEKVVVFDSDDATAGERPDDIQVGMTVQLSNQPNSLNSPAFKEALRAAKKVQFTLKEGIYWVNNKGEKTEYQLKPEDYFTKYARTVMLNVDYRHAHGGSKKADDYANEVTYKDLLEPNSNPFLPTTYYSNEYLIDLFGIDAQKLTKKESFLTPVASGEQAITFEAAAQTATNSSQIQISANEQPRQIFFDNFMDKIILAGDYFNPAPTDFIKANQSRNPGDVTGLAAEIGYYWYGAKFEDMLYAGPYVITESSHIRTALKMNPHYFDQEWVKDDSSIRSIVSENDGSEAQSFRTQNFELYKSGQIPSISFISLSELQQTEVLNSVKSGSKLFNLSYNVSPDYQGFSGGTLTWRSNLYANYQDPIVRKAEYAFNDAFALLMYGNTIADIEAGKVPTTSQHFWTGDGYTLRSILSSAFNYYAFTNELGKELTHWSSLARPDTPLGGKDQASAELKNLAHDPRQFGFFFYGGANGNQKFEKTLAADQQHSIANTTSQGVRYQSNNFDQLKQETKRLLDKFYGVTEANPKGTGIAQLPSDPHQKVKLTFFTRSSATTANRKSATGNAINVLKSLDPRLEINTADWSQERLDGLINAKSPHTPVGWYYDVNSYAGFLGGFLYPSRRYLWFTSLFHFADETTGSSTNPGIASHKDHFKEIRKLANAFKNSSLVFASGAKTWEEMKKGTNKDWDRPLTFMKKEPNSDYNPTVALARFALAYANGLTNQELADLNYEITSLMGIALNSTAAYQIARDPVPLLINRHYKLPVGVNGDAPSSRYARIEKDA